MNQNKHHWVFLSARKEKIESEILHDNNGQFQISEAFFAPFLDKKKITVRMIEIAHFSVHILLLHHYKSNLSHLSDFDSLVIGLSKSER